MRKNNALGCFVIPCLFFAGTLLVWVVVTLIESVIPGDDIAKLIGLILFVIGWAAGMIMIVGALANRRPHG